MAKQLNVDLRFNADVSAAKAQLQGLQTSINQLTTSMATQGAQLGITPKIQEAQQAAVQLKTALSQSMNVETGKFDLSKFNSSLKSMNTDLGKLKTQLVNLGPSGQQTFMTLAQSIMTAEIPTKRISASLAALGTTLKNTAKWQLSSSMLHGFMSAVQTSYRYAQDLNTSLNNIRIVTGESAEAMDKFAARANKAAKALSASTLDYTDAALIFYQQGLQGKEVEERAEITLKMANVSRQSAEIVSDQLTAVWNNFANGTDSLESFADKMVALGAATASSSDEIAGGLEKFAAVGETIGLSFDYAAAALATITSNTRQSEEVVGTALKTIFARIQGLKLGETLEDGTTLNKYSQALETVGVHIYNANGGLKNMDTILDETAAKWNTLTDDQKAALAQTVAGVRQYTQFISLMDNWESKGPGDKDSMKANLETINKSTGALQEQADIYAESWEAASKRVKASAEEIYMDLLDDDFFIDLTNGLADFLGLLDNLLDSMGGARGLLTGLSSILLNMFAGSAAKGLENMVYNFKTFIGLTQKEAMNIQTQTAALVRGVVASGSSGQPINNQQTAYLTGMESQVGLQHTLLNMKNKLSEQEQLTANAIIEQNAAYAHQVELLGQAADKAKEKTQVARDNVTNVVDDIYLNNANQASEDWRASIDTDTVTGNMQRLYDTSYKVVNQDLSAAKQQAQNINVNDNAQLGPAIKQYVEALNKAAAEIESIDGETELSSALKKKAEELNKVADKPADVSEKRKALNEIQQENSVFDTKAKMQVGSSVKTYGKNHLGIGSSAVTGGDAEAAIKAQERINKSVDGVVKSFKEEKKAAESAGKGVKSLKENTEEAEKTIKNLGNSTRSWSQTMVGVAQSAMSLSFAISSLNSLKTTWADETIGTGEKLLQTFMSLGMAIPMLINGINGLKTAYMGSATIQGALLLLEERELFIQQQKLLKMGEEVAGLTAVQLAKRSGMTLEQANQVLITQGMALKLRELGLTKTKIVSMTAEQLAEKTGMTLDQASIVISKLKAGANLTEALSEAGLTGAKTAGTIATKIATAANWGFLASLSPLLAITLVLVAALGGLALIIWGVTAAFKAIVNSTPEAKLKAAKEESQALSEQLNKAKEEANNLKAAFDDYDEVAKKLGECTKGTEEWNEALQENNNKVLELMDKYPKLASTSGAIGIGKDGQLVISEDARKGLIQEANNRVATAQIADGMGKQKVRDMEIEQLQEKKEKQSSMYVMGDSVGNSQAKQIYDAAVQKYGVSNLGVDEINSIIKTLKEQGKFQGISNEHLRDSTMELIETENALASAIKENTIATQAETAASAGAIMANNEDYQKSDYKGNIDLIVGANGFNQDSITVGDKTFEATGDQSAEQVLANDYKNRVADSNWWSFGAHATKDANAVFDEYLQYMGMDRFNMENIDFTGDAVYYNAIDPTTGEISDKKTKIDFDTIATTLAAKDAQQGAADYGAVIAKQMNSFENQDQADIFTAAMTNDRSLFSEELLKKNKEDIDKIVDSMEISDKVFEAMGEEAKKFGDDIDDQKKNFKSYQKEILQSAKGFDKLKKDGKASFAVITNEAEANAEAIKDGNYEWSEDAKKQAAKMSKSISDALGADADLGLDADFIAKNQGIIDDFINGVEGSGDRLKAALQEDAIIDVTANLQDDEMKAKLQNLHNNLIAFENKDWQVGVGIDPTKEANFYAACQNMIDAAGMTADQAQAYFGKMGYDVKFKKEKKKVTEIVWNKKYNNTYDDKGNLTATTVDATPVPINGEVEVPVIETITPNASFGGNIDNINSGRGITAPSTTKDDSGNTNPKGGGGGGGDKPKVVQKKAPIKPKKEKDEIERYHEISKAIEDQERVVDRLSKAKDKAYGANKLKAIDNEIAALQKLNELDSQHLKQIREKLALDRKAAAEEHGITFDEFGRINNYEEIIKQKMEWWRTEQQKIQDRETEYEKEKNYNEEYDADGAIKLKIDQDKEKIDEQYEDFKEAITQYEETFGLFEDTVDKMQDQFDQMAEKAIEKITYEVEFKVEFEESAIDLLDFQIELLGEDFDAFAEIASITMEKTTHLSKALQAQSDGVGALYEAYDKGAISLDQFVENMKESLPDILSSMQNMISLDKEMMEYYSKAFDAAEEKFTEYLDFIDSGISKLDHFQNMLSLIGKEQNYDMLGVVLESQYTSASHRLQASSDWYETTKKEYDALYNRWIAEKNLLGPKELEMLEEKLKVARTKMQEADEQRLSDLEAVGEKAQEILQNNLNMARKKFEENLVGSSLEDYMNELDRLSKKQEEYLTNTNKMYETNKLIRQAQMEMDKTDNNRAKQQYNDYVKYIEQLQETGKLSSYELSVAQAKYELLQAQIALEEAKDAKDQVRLTRDSEGNYGYVYTANEDKVSDAEQAVADAENKLYNIGLDGAQDYQSKKAEILQEAIDTFASIEEQYQTGQIKTEAEFNAKMEEAKQYYYNRLKEYDNLYYMALGVMQEESYGNTIDYELDSRNVFDTFATHVDGYLGDVEQSFTDYNNKVGVVKQEVGDDLEAMRKKTEEVTKETEKLTLEAEKLTDQIDNELLSVREATSIWGAYRDELYKNIEANKTLIEQLRTIQELQGGELADYSSFISDQVAKGKGYDDRLIQEALAKRWLKMEGKDDYDYSQMKNDYVQEYADLNGLTFEEAETALQDDAWYKTLDMLRQYKIERTDWEAMKKEILDKDPEADVSWIDNIIAEKLNYDWSAKIQQYIENNPGLKYSDEYLQEMLTMRQIKIDSLEDPKSVISNDELLAPYIEKGKLIDDRKNVSSAVSAATGGYTGEWGPEGKIAILHEKELILNAQDTQNFLSAVEILREINGILDQNALVASLGAINMQALSLNSLADQVLQQEVTIHADFPNVTDHNEIELAIDNLINAASQHAYRT